MVGQRIKAARKRAGLTSVGLAERLSLCKRAIDYWESGGREPGMADLCRVAVVCGVTLTWLVMDLDLQRAEIAQGAAA